MRTIFMFGFFALYQVYSILHVIRYKFLGLIGKKDKQKELLEKISTRWAKNMIKTTGSTVEVIGLENVPGINVLYVANHQSYLDIPLIMGFLPKFKGFVAKIELAKMPIVSGWMKAIGSLFLDRTSIRQSMQVILEGIEMLKNGSTLVIFPEGTRSKDGLVDEFKKGSLQLAVKSGVPVVPVTIDGTYNAYEKFKKVIPTKIKLTIHPPIYMENLTTVEKKELAETVRTLIVSALPTEKE